MLQLVPLLLRPLIGVIATSERRTSLITALRRGAAASLGVRLISMGVIFALQLALARSLSATEFGLYSYAGSVIPILTIFAGAGLPLVAPRFVPQYLADNRPDLLNNFLAFGRKLILGICLALILISVGMFWWGRDSIDHAHRFLYLQVCILLLPLCFLQFTQQALRGFRRIAASQVAEQVLTPAALLLVIFFSDRWGIPLTACSVLVIQTVLFAAGAFVLRSYLTRLTGEASGNVRAENGHPEKVTSDNKEASYRGTDRLKPADRLDVHEWLGAAGPLAIAAGAWVLFSRMDVLVIGPMLGASSVAAYSIPARLTALLYLGLTALDSIYAPVVAESYRLGKMSGVQHLTTTVGRWAFLGACPLLLLLFVADTAILSAFGPEYPRSAPLLRILLLGQLATILVGPVDSLLTMTGHQRPYLQLLLASLAASAIALPLAAQWGGLPGIAWTATGVCICWKLALSVLAWNRLGIRPWVADLLAKSSEEPLET